MKQPVRINNNLLAEDFMFEMNKQEFEVWSL
jgi:hypothetical protein